VLDGIFLSPITIVISWYFVNQKGHTHPCFSGSYRISYREACSSVSVLRWVLVIFWNLNLFRGGGGRVGIW